MSSPSAVKMQPTKQIASGDEPIHSSNRKERFCAFAVRHRVAVLLSVLVATLVVALGSLKIQSDVILWHLFPYGHPYFLLTARFSEVFGGGGSTVVIAVRNREGDIFNPQTLAKVKHMTEEIELWEEIYRLQTHSMSSHSTKVVVTGAGGSISVAPLMFPEVPKTEQGMALLKKNIYSNPAYHGSLVSRDGTAALITTVFKDDISYEEAFELLSSLTDRYADDHTSIHIVGFPMMMGWIYSYKPQMYTVFAISLGLMVVLLFIVFRNLAGMTAPIAMSMICTGLGLGFVGWTGLNFSPLLYVLAFLVGARMLSNAVQITNRYVQEYKADSDPKLAARRTMEAMMMPNITAVITDAMGFLVLALAKIVLMLQIAIMMSFWMLTIMLSGLLVPIICSLLPMRTDDAEIQERVGGLARLNKAVAAFSIGQGKYLIWLVVAVILVGGAWQSMHLKVGDPTPGSPILWPDSTYNRDQALINSLFNASSETLSLYYDGDQGSVYDPIVLDTFEKFDRHMAEALPDIYKSSMSIINMVKMVHLMYRDGDQLMYQLPKKPAVLMNLMGMLRQGAGHATIGRFVDQNRERSQIILFFSDHTSDNMLRIRDAAYSFFEDHPVKIDKGEFKLAGGSIGMELALNEEMKTAHAKMDTLVLVTIFVMCSIGFRSFVAGAMLTLPLILSNLIAFSYMAAANIGLSVNTLPCSAVGVGVGVDFSIYLYSRCMESFPKHNDLRETVLDAVQKAGRGIVFTGIILILPIMTWYFISELKFQAQMGFFLAILLFANMVFALTLHPLIIMVIKPRFIRKKMKDI